MSDPPSSAAPGGGTGAHQPPGQPGSGTGAHQPPGTGAIQPTFAGASKPPSSGVGGVVRLIAFVGVLAGLAYGMVTVWVGSASSGYAEVIFLRGQAKVGDRVLGLGDKLPPNQPVELGDGARCFLQLPSGMVLKLASKARLTLGTSPESPMSLDAGSLHIDTKPGEEALLPTAPIHVIRLPNGGQVEARSKKLELRVEKEHSILAVFDGAAKVHHGDAKQAVEVGAAEGSVIRSGKTEKVTLPTPPNITSHSHGDELKQIAPEVACEHDEVAAGYLWEVRTADGYETIHRVTLDGKSGRLPALPRDGHYRLTVRRVIELGGGARIEGLLSEPVRVKLGLFRESNRRRNLAHNLHINGKHALAVDQARNALELWPTDPKMLRTLAHAHFQLGQIEEGLKAANALKSSTEVGAADHLGELLLELRKTHADHPGVKALESK